MCMHIEDEDRLCDTMRRGVWTDGHEAIAAPDGEIGLHLAREETFDAVSCPILTPKKNGFQICEELRDRIVHTHFLC